MFVFRCEKHREKRKKRNVSRSKFQICRDCVVKIYSGICGICSIYLEVFFYRRAKIVKTVGKCLNFRIRLWINFKVLDRVQFFFRLGILSRGKFF